MSLHFDQYKVDIENIYKTTSSYLLPACIYRRQIELIDTHFPAWPHKLTHNIISCIID